MTELAIHQLTATVPAEQADRAATVLRRVRTDWLDRAWQPVTVPPGHWCVRQLRVQLALAGQLSDAGLQQLWAQALVDALVGALGSGSPDVLHYPRTVDALTDLLVSLCHRDLSRRWAWRRLGLALDQGPDPALRPADAAVAALAGRPADALPALIRTVASTGFAALHRLLGQRGWQAVGALLSGGPLPDSPAALGRPGSWSIEPGDPTGPGEHGADQRAGAGWPVSAGTGPRPAVCRLASALADASTLARAILASGLRADPPTARLWALLVIAESDPASLRHPGLAALLTELAVLISPEPAGPGLLAAPAGRPEPPRPELPRSEPLRSEPHREPSGPDQAHPVPAAPAGARPVDEHSPDAGLPIENQLPLTAQSALRPSPVEHREAAGLTPSEQPAAGEAAGRPTGWAGLLFLLATAPAAGIPDQLRADPVLAGRSVRWLLHQLGLLLVPVAPDDPAVLACCGLSGDQPPPGGVPDAAERTCLLRHAERWLAVTAELLDEPVAEFRPRLRRTALVIAEPGWIEVRMAADEVDLELRRAGLDLDPGWVPWLGAVVRYRYV